MISVIIPIYNRAHTIRRAVNSVLAQSFQDFELILVDDGSTDNSLKLCREYEKCDARVKVFHTKENRGVSAARNLGIKKSSGEYIRFVDSDDELPKNSLKDLITPILKDSSIELVVACLDGYGFGMQKFESHPISKKDFLLQFFQIEYQCLYRTPCNKLYLRSVMDANTLLFDESMSYSEDTQFNFRYYSCIDNIYLSNCIVYFVHHPRGEPGHLSGRYNQDIEKTISNSLVLYNIHLVATANITPNYKKHCATLLMDSLWSNMCLIRKRSDYPILKQALCSYDWAVLLAECPTETYFWRYKFLHKCLIDRKIMRLFWFFRIRNRINDLLPDNGRRILRPLVNKCRWNLGRRLEEQ